MLVEGDRRSIQFGDGRRLVLSLQSDGSYRNLTDGLLQGAVLTSPGGVPTLRWKDGSTWAFGVTLSSQFGVTNLGLTQQRDRNGNTITNTWSGTRITTIAGPDGRQLLLDYDGSNRVTRVTDPIGRTVQYAYDGQGNLATVTDPEGGTTRYEYDNNNRMTRITDPKNIMYLQNFYGPSGRVLRQIQADGSEFRFRYQVSGGTRSGLGCPVLPPGTAIPYSTVLVGGAAPCPSVDSWENFQAGYSLTGGTVLATTVVDPRGNTTITRFNTRGYPISTTDALGQTSTTVYSSANQALSTTDPLGKVETYEYDGNDNLTKRHTPKGDDILFAYDAVNQLLNKTLPGNQVTNYVYDLVGNLTSVTDPDSALTMTYDPANRLLTTSTAGASHQPSVTLTYTYDKNGNRLTLNGGTASHTYVYDGLNRLTSVTTPTGAATFAYDPLSRRTNLTLPNGTQTTYSYDPASQVQSILHKLGATGPTINQATYTYNGVGNRDSLTDRRGVQNFGYDNLDRLTSASHPLLGTPQSFTYDAVGNRTTAGNVTNAGNQLTADATHSYQYDDNGNLTRKTLLATGNYTQYSYDAENRLVKVEDFVSGNPTAAFTSTYRYDGLGRRIEKVANGQTKRYVYDGEDILLEYDGTNTLQARYTHGPGIDEPIAVTKGGSTFFYHQDGLGSVTDLTDSAGATAKSYSYDAYGNILESPGTVEQPYTYTGREFDSESGLLYYRARYYDATSGRFLHKDPIGFAGGDLNLYAYVKNNPTDFIDPAGMATITIPFPIPNDPSLPGVGTVGRALGRLGLILNILTLSGDTPNCPDSEA